jgi:hypothetical protein
MVKKDSSIGMVCGVMVKEHCHYLALLALSQKLAAHCGIDTIDGLPIREWVEKQTTAEIEGTLSRYDEDNPGEPNILRAQPILRLP